MSWSELVSVRACLFGWPGVCCMGSFPFLLLNIMIHSSPAFFEEKSNKIMNKSINQIFLLMCYKFKRHLGELPI